MQIAEPTHQMQIAWSLKTSTNVSQALKATPTMATTAPAVRNASSSRVSEARIAR
jgi:hypothetical protein